LAMSELASPFAAARLRPPAETLTGESGSEG
jgi:hypothetical protein